MHTELPNGTAMVGSDIQAERCITELQRGRSVILTNDEACSDLLNAQGRVIHLVETLNTPALRALISEHDCQLVVSQSRALALGHNVADDAVCLELASSVSAETVQIWAGLRPDISGHHHANTPEAIPSKQTNSLSTPDKSGIQNAQYANAARNLALHAHALPALIMYPAQGESSDLLSVSTRHAKAYSDQSGELMRLSSVRIPLATADSVELTVFRERHGHAEHVAITVGQPDFSDTVTVRLHSSCFTGDILGSMKCDCGEQLQTAITNMAKGDGGVVLYVSQEGRGIGLASKLLAYQLQHQGMDTIDANQHLGFDADERNYAAAAFMLEQLGIGNIHLVTNNPLKIKAMRDHGVTVHDRVPSLATVNVHNARYLETKRKRAGHYTNSETVG